MATYLKPGFTYYVLTNEGKQKQALIHAINEVVSDLEGDNIKKNKLILSSIKNVDLELEEISKSDLVFATLNNSVDISYGLGLAHALGKPVIYLIQDSDSINANKFLPSQFVPGGIIITYEYTENGLVVFKKNIKKLIVEYKNDPLRFTQYLPFFKKKNKPNYIIDLDKLEPREYENLCFELISQMGFRKVKWGLEMKEIDLVATLPKKDPDGFEYEELWLIVTGKNKSPELLLDRIIFEPEYIFDRVLKSDFFYKNKLKTRSDIPITILFIFKDDMPDFYLRDIEDAEMRFRHRKYPMNVRIRTWDSMYFTKLIQTSPQITYKYFSEQYAIKSEHRKSQEELNIENRKLTEQLLKTNTELEEEKRKRFIAEKEMAWKDVAFKAAHKLGNPIDAIDTYLQSLKRKLNDHETEKAKKTAIQMDEILEEAKIVIAQFKSLSKIEEINPQPTNIENIIKRYSDTANEKGIRVNIQSEKDIPAVLVDPDKMKECFSELFANSNHWFNKDSKSIEISIAKAIKTKLPDSLNKQKKYVKITYTDNGSGIEKENKEKIFFPTFSKYQHGSGLGLSLLKKTIELQGGGILENGVFGKGANFEIYLPLVEN